MVAAEAMAIVRDLAAVQPGELTGNMSQCVFCEPPGDLMEPEGHQPSCLWRRARALYPKV
jgi:hypothetical protein